MSIVILAVRISIEKNGTRLSNRHHLHRRANNFNRVWSPSDPYTVFFDCPGNHSPD